MSGAQPSADQDDTDAWPRFDQISEPRMIALYTANGSGTKLYQGFLDGHPQLYMVPAYPLMYLYPHWQQWREELRDNWNWPALIDIFCVKHASVLDTRRIPGFDGLAALGESRSEYLSIDEASFRRYLAHLLEGESLQARTFLLAIHYAYAFCRGEDLTQKRALVYHIHVHEYLSAYLIADFPDMLVIGTVRDPRSNFSGRYNHSEAAVDAERMNKTDAMIYRRRVYVFIMRYFCEGLDILGDFPLERVRVVRHEDLARRLDDVMRNTAAFIGTDYDRRCGEITFGGRLWWGDKIYDMEPMNRVNPRVLSLDWQKRIDPLDCYVFEGLFSRYLEKYDYPSFKYRDALWNRVVLFFAMLLPSQTEREEFANYLRPSRLREFWRACLDEASGAVPLKDYSFNAYYRHKWTQKDLRLADQRWYREVLRDALQKPPGDSAPGQRLRLRAAQIIYVAASVLRYAGSILVYPAMLARRWRVTGAAYWRMVAGRNVLPTPL